MTERLAGTAPVPSHDNPLGLYAAIDPASVPFRHLRPTINETTAMIEALQRPGELVVAYTIDRATQPTDLKHGTWTIGWSSGQVQTQSRAFEQLELPTVSDRCHEPLIVSTPLKAANGSNANRLELTISSIFTSILGQSESYHQSGTVIAIGKTAARNVFARFFPAELRRSNEFLRDSNESEFLKALIVGGITLGEVGYPATYVTEEWKRILSQFESTVQGEAPYTHEILRLAPLAASNHDALETVKEVLDSYNITWPPISMRYHQHILSQNLEPRSEQILAG